MLPLTFAGATNGSIREASWICPVSPQGSAGRPGSPPNIHLMGEGSGTAMTYNYPEDLSDPKRGCR